jgi:hypothetical protein
MSITNGIAVVIQRTRDRVRTMRRQRVIRAVSEGAPFEFKRFWPPFYIYFGTPAPGGAVRVLNDVYDAKVGDVVSVLLCPDGRVHRYKLLAEGRAPGDDHIVSPREFDLEYWETVRA